MNIVEQNKIPRVYILPLADEQAKIETVGGKGVSLARLSRAGLPVPNGFHITAGAYRRFVEEGKLQEQIQAIVAGLTPNQPAKLKEASTRIEDIFTHTPIPKEVGVSIRAKYAELGGEDLAVAVRSSATMEDSTEVSFAGQQETYLNMRGEALVLEAVKLCWTSLWEWRALSYRARNNIINKPVGMAVVVQEFLPADAAGIMFTMNPSTEMRNRVIINAVWGLGESIVGGQTADTFVVDKISRKVVEQQINAKDMMIVRTRIGTHQELVPEDRRTQAVLNMAQVAELTHVGVKIEELYGQPMGVEWLLTNGRFFVLHAHPIN